ncbi:MAG: hypothetical protein JWM47_2201 [Acidimicrobiales bacterium]|nr:hypothetical protein [Acidimicrobiales bacterium]
MTTSVEIDAALEVVAHLPLVDVPDHLLNLAEVLRRPDPAVAIVGLVSRGKSTLLNKLCGAMVSRPSMRPETASIVTVRSGSPSATGSRADGTVIDLPSEPDAFARSAQRFGGEGLRWAELSGSFRLPTGLVLIDTPGLDDAAGDLDEDLAHVIDDWRSCGATAAVVVTAFPPGILRRDRELIERATAVFGTNVRVVLLTTTPEDVDRSDLEDVAEDAAAQFGAPILIIPPDDGTGNWCTGPLGELEQQISVLSQGAAHAHRRAQETAGKLLDKMTEEIRALDQSELPALVVARECQPAALPLSFRAAIGDTIDRYETERADVERAAGQAERRRRLAVLDAGARRLGPVLLGHHAAPVLANQRQAADELRSMALEGSRVAQEQLAHAAGLASDRRRSIGLPLATLVPLLPPELQADALARSTPGGDEVFALLGLVVVPQVRSVLEFAAVRGARQGLGLTELDRVAAALTGTGPTFELIKVQVDRIVAEMAAVPVDGLSLGSADARFTKLLSRATDLRERLERLPPGQPVAPVLGRLEVAVRSLVRDLACALSNTIEAAIGEPAEDAAPWWRSTEGHRRLGQTLMAFEIGAVAPDLPMQLHLFDQHGPSWAQESARQVAAAQGRGLQVRANQKTLWSWTWAPVVAAVVLFMIDGGLGLLAIAGTVAFVMYASKRDDPPEWRRYYQAPPTPWALPEGRTALPVRSQ